MQNLVTYSSQLINNSPAIILHVEGENKKRVFLFDDPASVASALEMLKTFEAQLDNGFSILVTYDGDNGILISTDTENFLFTFSNFDISAADRLLSTYNSLTSDNGDENE